MTKSLLQLPPQCSVWRLLLLMMALSIWDHQVVVVGVDAVQPPFFVSRGILLHNNNHNGHLISNLPSPYQYTSSVRRSPTGLYLVDFLWDFLEPFENMWEFYVNRDDIIETWIEKSTTFAKTKTIRFTAYTVGVFGALDLIARVGIIGKRGQGLWATLRDSDEVHGTFEEKFFQKITRETAEVGVNALRKFRRFGGKSKFGVAFAGGALFYETAVRAASGMVKMTIGSFVILEAASFSGVIGDPGESIVEWVEDHKADAQSWNRKLKSVKVFVNRHMSMEKLGDFYEVAVDEEKVACAGFALGSLFAIFTW